MILLPQRLETAVAHIAVYKLGAIAVPLSVLFAESDEEGNLRDFGRTDDIIVSGGYRIGPGEVEQSLLRHPAVALAAVVGRPDEVWGEIVKAFVVLGPGTEPSPELASELQGFVRSRPAAHEYPREVEFANALPLTTTGKIRRGELRRLEAERERRTSAL